MKTLRAKKILSLIVILSALTFLGTFSVHAQKAQNPADNPLVPCGTETYPKDTIITDAKGVVRDVGGQVSNPCDFDYLLVLVNTVVTYVIILGASVATIAFAYAGFLMMTASGEMSKVEKAKSIFGKVVIGFLIMLSAWLIVRALELAFLDPRVVPSLLK